jgi:hypothetical protein
MEAAHAFIDGVRDQEVKQHLLMCSDRALNEVLNQALKMIAAKKATRPPARLREVTSSSAGMTPTPPESRRHRRPACWQCGTTGHLRKDCRQRQRKEMDQGSGNE